jgi:ABC-type branched-subunit amino acid transport system ATPase component
MNLLEVHDLVSGYEKMVIIQDVSFNVGNNDIVAIVGPNGSGKSTLIKSILGFASIFHGSITYQGKNITNERSDLLIKMGISYVPQINNVFLNLTVEENLDIGLYMIGKNKGTLKKEEVLRLFPVLEEKKNKKAYILSGGERQMLALASAIALDPKLLILDEPSVGLAPKLRREFYEKLLGIRDNGVTIIMVEQNVRAALKISDKGLVLVSGRKVFEGSSEEILNNPDLGKIFLGKVSNAEDIPISKD